MQAFDSILCVVQKAQNATHARDKKIPCTPKVPHSAPKAGACSCKRSRVSSMRGSKGLNATQCTEVENTQYSKVPHSALGAAVCVRASVR